MSIRETIDRSPISRFQAVVVLVCLVLNMIDGFDLLVMAFAASGVAASFGLSGAQTGLLLSSSLAGMALGSAVLAPLADRIGRRRLTVACLMVSTVGMILAAASTGFVVLAVARVITGIGIGGLVVSLPVLLAEYSPQRRRSAVIALYTTGLPLGGVVGGAVAALLIAQYGWRGPFVAGAVITFVMLLIVLAALPESIDYLVFRRPADALKRINVLLRRMGQDTLTALPPASARDANDVRKEVVGGGNGLKSALLWASFFVMMAGFYFAASWTPRLLEQSGLSAQQGINGGVLLNLGGVVAALAFSVLALRVSGRLITVASFICAGLAFLAMGFALGNLAATLVVAVAIGIFNNGGASGLFVLAPDMYPASVRTTALGWAAAFGRLGAIAAPILAGILVDQAWTPGALFALFAVPMLLAAPAILVMTRTRTGPPLEAYARA
ncbi:MFS transporter [Micromonosporaceae bacterium Da 78-11]